MTDRSPILSLYRQLLLERLKKGRLMPDDVHAIQVFCEVHQITLQEHREMVSDVGLDPRELMDEHSRSFEDWLENRRQPLAIGSGGLRYKPEGELNPWKKKLALPAGWQTGLAVVAGVVFMAAVVYIITRLI